jgi:Xaa-Pro aminopeptidase
MERSDWRDEEDVLKFSPQEIERRHQKIRELMQLRGIDCLVVTGHTGTHGAEAANVNYIAGISGFFQGGTIHFPFAGDPVFFAASPVMAVRVSEASHISVEPVAFKPGTRIRDYATSTIDHIKKMGLEKGTIGIASMRVMPADMYRVLRRDLPYADFIAASDVLLEARRIKSAEEMAFVRKSGEAADRGAEAIIEAARPGVTEEELVAYCDMAMVKAGAPRGNFILLSSGPWPDMRGTIGGGGQRRLRKGDLILNEITSCYGGYYTQLCVPISLGRDLPKDFMSLLDIHKAMHRTASGLLRPGNRIFDIEEKVAEVASGRGMEFRRAWATQSGELAEAFFKLNTELKPGMTYVDHPWTELKSGEGFQGHTIGNTFIVTEGEPEPLHRTVLDLRIV